VTQYRVAILGATGAVGSELLRLLDEREFPVAAIRLLASPRSQGKALSFRGDHLPVMAVSESSFEGVDIAFFSAGAEAARKWSPVAQEAGATVIDNSSAFRLEPNVPLIIPEINWHKAREEIKYYPVGNCTGIILAMTLAPLRKFGRFRRIVVSTYQSASGAGARAMRELEEQARAFARGEELHAEALPYPILFNLFSHNSPINEHGYNEEEWKVIREVRKVLEQPELPIEVTSVRVPVQRAHSMSVNVEFDCPAPSVEAVREAVQAFPGLELVDDRAANRFPMPMLAGGRDPVLVGRIRRDISNPNALSLFSCGDQLRKGAALNAIQIAEKLVESGYLM
jgi:aspartate-semialdehyde dehydrogenase